jgi:hypothetical protein
MRSQIRSVRRPSADDGESAEQIYSGGESVSNLLEKISLKDVPLEERRKEAKKPLYLVRYE